MDDMTRNHLSPRRHKTGDLFVADLFGIATKDDLASMEHPLFALKAGDKTIRRYERNGVHVQIEPGQHGHATIHDKDIWIYCISQLTEAMNRGRLDVSRTVQFTAYDFLVSTNRQTSGRGYDLLTQALRRLSTTAIFTNIKTGRRREKKFSLINDYDVIEKDDEGRMVAIEVELPKWLMRAIEARQVLTISPEYFQLRKAIDRRIYELARKHCGAQSSWKVSLAVLHEKSGSQGRLKEFRRAMRSLVDSNQLPDYRVKFNQKSDMLTFYSRKPKGQVSEMMDALSN